MITLTTAGNAAPHGVLEHHGATRARASRAKVSFSASSTKVVLSRDDFLAFDPNEGAPRLGKRHTAGGEKKRQQARAPPGFVVVHGYRCGKCGPCMHPHWKQGCKQRFVPEDKAEEIRAQVAAEKAAEKGVPPPAAPPPSVGTRRSARSSARRDDSDSAPVPDVARALGLEAPAGRGADSGALAAALQRLRAAREALDEEGVVPEAARPGEAAGGGAVGAEATEGDAGARTRNPYRRRAPGAAGRKGGEPRRFNRAAYMAVRWFQPPLPVKPALAPAPKAEPAPAPRGPVKRSKDGLELVDDLGDEALIPLVSASPDR